MSEVEPYTEEYIQEQLKDMNRYNPDNQVTFLICNPFWDQIQPMLEDYVMQQVRDGTYDLDGNMALLKLYQFYPNSVRYEVK